MHTFEVNQEAVMKYSSEKIGKKILNERNKLELTQSQLGNKLNVVGKQISNYENGKTIPPMEILLKMCEIFHCELGYLLDEDDYSDKTKINTRITQTTGLDMYSIQILNTITGTSRSALSFGYQSENYRRILNSLISSPYFIEFIKCLYDLDNSAISPLKNLENKIGKSRFDMAHKLYHSGVDYEHDTDSDNLSAEQISDFAEYESCVDASHDLSYDIKIARYELNRIFETMIDSLYPDNN